MGNKSRERWFSLGEIQAAEVEITKSHSFNRVRENIERDFLIFLGGLIPLF